MKPIHKIIDLLRFGAEYITIKNSLLRSILFFIFLTSASILTVFSYGSHLEVNDLSVSLLLSSTDTIEAELNDFFEPIKKYLIIISDWNKSGLIDLNNHKQFYDLLSPLLQEHSPISSLHVTKQNRENMLLNKIDHMVLRITDPDNLGKKAIFVKWKENNKQSEKVEDFNYTLSQRKWYKSALDQPNQMTWTKPYIFFTTQEIGITVSILQNNEELETIALDILLNDISNYTSRLKIKKNGMAFVFTEDEKFLGLPHHSEFESKEHMKKAYLTEISKINIKAIRESFRHWSLSDKARLKPFEFEINGEMWWANVRPYHVNPNLKFYICVIVPENDFLSDIKRLQIEIMIAVSIVLCFVAFLTLALAKTYSKPIEELTIESKRITNLDLSSDKVIKSEIYEVDQLSKAQVRLRSAIDSFSKYVPVGVVKDLIEVGEVAKIGGKFEDLTILFTDIKDFTNLSEKMHPTDLTRHLADYFETMLDVLNQENATIDKFIGDSILAFWGAPKSDKNQVKHGLLAVLRCIDALEKKNVEWIQAGLPPLSTRFGLDKGSVVVGNVGSRVRLNYTILGDKVNRASRLEGLNKVYGTNAIVSEDIVQAAGQEFIFRILDKVAVKGKSEPVAIYEPIGLSGNLLQAKLDIVSLYEKAFELYQIRDFQNAQKILEDIQEYDPPSSRLFEICSQLMTESVPENWDGVYRFHTK